jgi:hypothetical protein
VTAGERYAREAAVAEVVRSLHCDCFYPDEHAEYGDEPCAKHRLLDLLELEPTE